MSNRIMRNEELGMRNDGKLFSEKLLLKEALQSNANRYYSLFIIHYSLKTPKEFS